MVNFGPLVAEILSLVVGVSQTAALNRGRGTMNGLLFVSDIAIFVLKKDVKLQLTN